MKYDYDIVNIQHTEIKPYFLISGPSKHVTQLQFIEDT